MIFRQFLAGAIVAALFTTAIMSAIYDPVPATEINGNRAEGE